MQLLSNPHSTPVKRSSGTVFRQVHSLALICRSSQMFHFVVFINDESHIDFVLKDTSQPLNLTAKPKTPSPQALELAHLQTGYRPRDLPHSPPRSALSLSMWHYTTPTHPVSNITVGLRGWSSDLTCWKILLQLILQLPLKPQCCLVDLDFITVTQQVLQHIA